MSDQKKVVMSEDEYYKLVKMTTFMSTPFAASDFASIKRVQDSALAVHCELLIIGDRNLLPRVQEVVERRTGEDRRKQEQARERQDQFDREQIREYEKQVREEG